MGTERNPNKPGTDPMRPNQGQPGGEHERGAGRRDEDTNRPGRTPESDEDKGRRLPGTDPDSDEDTTS